MGQEKRHFRGSSANDSWITLQWAVYVSRLLSGLFMVIFPGMRNHGGTESEFADDARLFFSIQISRYLSVRKSRRFSGAAERDAVMAMIKDAWVELRSTSSLADLSPQGREALFESTLMAFPTFIADSGLRCIPVDFISGRRIGDQIIAWPGF